MDGSSTSGSNSGSWASIGTSMGALASPDSPFTAHNASRRVNPIDRKASASAKLRSVRKQYSRLIH